MIALTPHADAVLTRLRSVTFASQALKVGDGVAPKSPNGNVVSTCAVLHGRDGGTLESSIGCLDTDGWLPFQVTAVGATAAEARAVADKCSAALTATLLPVPNRWCRIRRTTPSSNAERDDDLVPPLFYVTTLYRLLSNAA